MKSGVYLIGAGPGDPELITVKGARLLEAADVVVYDQLANPILLAYTKSNCEKIYVGKKAGNHAMAQEDINNLLVDLSKIHPLVVRLKGGDPYVFGRGGEEGQVLFKAGVYFEVVPGISSAIGGLAYAGIPITYRKEATSFHVVTGHLSKGTDALDYRPLAQMKGTLVFLMGVGNLETIVSGLLDNGKDPTTPVAIIYKASTPYQKVTEGTLTTISKIAEKAEIKPPSLIVVGEVIRHRQALNYFEKSPLFGRHVLLTRAKESKSKMAEQLMAMGAQVTQLPAVKIVPQNLDFLVDEIKAIDQYKGIIFTSGVAVKLFFDLIDDGGLDPRYLHDLKIFAVGGETGKALKKVGIRTDLIPKTFTKEGLGDLIHQYCGSEDKLLMPRSARGDKAWLTHLQANYRITEVQCYDTVNEEETKVDMSLLTDVTYIAFTSGSTAEGYLHLAGMPGNEQLQSLLAKAKIVAIGPTTRSALEGRGVRVDLQPMRYTIDDMVTTIVDDALKMKE